MKEAPDREVGGFFHGNAWLGLVIWRDVRHLCETTGLVMDLGRDLTKLVFVGACVVGTEQEFSAIAQFGAYVGLSTTAIATIRRVER